MNRQSPISVGVFVSSLLMVVCADFFAQSAQTAPAAYRDEWKPIPRTLSELLDTDYHIVTIIAPSPQTRLYFLHKPGGFVKCTEQASLHEPPPLPPNLPSASGGAPPEPPDPPKPMTGKTTSQIECSELTRSATRRP